MQVLGVETDAAVATRGDRIAAVGPRAVLEREFRDAERIDCSGCIVTPGLVDSHTHAVFGRPRYEEHELRASGVGYMEIARRGGGIHSSMRDTATRTESELVALTRPRLARLAAHGTTTIEIKSGYGLSTETELMMLRAIRTLAAESPLRIVPTWLGAHEIPATARATDRTRSDWLAMLREEMLPAVARERLAEFADVFCEPGVYTVPEARSLLVAEKIVSEGKLEQAVADRYAGWRTDLGERIAGGKLSLAELSDLVLDKGIDPKPRSGRQEALENLVNRYV